MATTPGEEPFPGQQPGTPPQPVQPPPEIVPPQPNIDVPDPGPATTPTTPQPGTPSG